jgi:hypothetical protein
LGNDVNMGEIIIDFVTKGCKEGVCGPKKRALLDDTPRTPVARTTDAELPIDTSLPADTSLAADTSDNPDAAGNLLGINCRGSGFCGACNMGINEAIFTMNQIKDDVSSATASKFSTELATTSIPIMTALAAACFGPSPNYVSSPRS